ncbi:MAG: pyruvate kinase [Flavobacteriales bacterium]|nr:pyruvate kinase [Flavobacteriales bacterium]
MLKNKTKIVATIGPASSPKEVLKKMIEEGMSVARLNFSHGEHDIHEEVMNTLRQIDSELHTHTAILADLSGPKLRVGELKTPEVELVMGAELRITSDEIIGDANRVMVSYPDLVVDVQIGETILFDDGKLRVEVTGKEGTDVITKVTQSGMLKPRKGVNLPDTKVSLPCLTDKDLIDLEFALNHNVSWVALSFVRSDDDIKELRQKIAESGKNVRIIAKIEKPEAVENIDAIIHEADGIMVARGDLGVEIPLQNVPLVQKEIVRKCQKAGRPVIIATQMMESMIDNMSPSRAEVNDVANAVMDGADAVMLSGETSVGKFPIEVVQTMSKIITRVEDYQGIYFRDIEHDSTPERVLTDAICHSAVRLSQKTGAKAIVTMSFSGYTAFRVSSYRPNAWIFVFTSNFKILNMLSLVWGVKGFYYDKFVSTDHTIADIKYELKKAGFLNDDDLIINVASMPIAKKGMSNMLKVSKMSEG